MTRCRCSSTVISAPLEMVKYFGSMHMARLMCGVSLCRSQVSHNPTPWKAWYDTEAPEAESIPGGFDGWMSAFDRLLMVRCWCPHRTLREVHKYVLQSLGSKYVDVPELDLTKLAENGNCRAPLIGLISVGVDLTNSIETAAKQQKIGESVTHVMYSCPCYTCNFG